MDATRAVEIIDELFTDEQKDLLKVVMANNIVISFKDQLHSEFYNYFPLYPATVHRIKAARIIQANRFNIMKLKNEEEVIRQLLDQESFYKSSVQVSDTEKLTDILSEVGSNNKSLNASHTKSIGGSGAHATESDDIIHNQDAEAEEAITKVINADLNQGAIEEKEWVKIKDEKGIERTRLQKKEKVVPVEGQEPAVKPIDLTVNTLNALQEDGEYEAPINDVVKSDARSTVVTVTDSVTRNQKSVSGGKYTHQTTLTYEKAKALEKIYTTQLFSLREHLINQFHSLFSREKLCL